MAVTRENTLYGALLVTFAGCCFASAGLFVQLASRHAGEFLISFGSLTLCAVIVVPFALARGRRFLVSQHTGLLIVRSVIGVIQVVSLFVALQTISLVDTVLLRDAAPLWIPVLLMLFWNQTMPNKLWIGIILGFVGMALVLHPSYTTFESGYLFAIGAGVLFAFQSILSRRIDEVGEPLLRTTTYIFITGSVLMAVPAAMQWQPVPIETLIHIALSGVCLLASTTSLVFAYNFAPAYVLAPFGYSAVVFSALLDWLLYDHVPTGWTVLGAVLVVAASLLIIRMTRRQKTTKG
ncbi:MAG: DMT family transporter [Pseudomonadota bacterium]